MDEQATQDAPPPHPGPPSPRPPGTPLPILGEGPGVRGFSTPPGEGSSRAERRHRPPPDLTRPPFDTAAALLGEWREGEGHLFDEPLPLLARLLALGTAAHLTVKAADFDIQGRAGAMLLRHLPGPRAPFDPARGGKGWGSEGEVERVQSLVSGLQLRRPAGEPKPKRADDHLVLRARKALLALAARIRDERRDVQAGEDTLEDWAVSIALWIRDCFEPRHFQERLVFLGIAAPLAALLAGNDAERLQAAQRLLSLTAPFARRKFARYSLDKPDDPPQAEDYDPWPEVMAELAAMNEEAGAAPPIAADAPT